VALTPGKRPALADADGAAPVRIARLLRESALLHGAVHVFGFLEFASGFLVAKLLGRRSAPARATVGAD
jgi:hypothetical protein